MGLNLSMLTFALQIFLYGNETKYNREIRVNETVNAIIINHLVHGMAYRIQLLAFTKIGDGPPSDPTIVGTYHYIVLYSQ